MYSECQRRVDKQLSEGDRLYLIAENLAQDFSLFPTSDVEEPLPGLLSPAAIRRRQTQLGNLDIDSYIEAVVSPAEDPKRLPAPAVIRLLGRVTDELSDGPFYQAVVELEFDDDVRSVGFIAQDRSSANGVWMPEHHLAAAEFIELCSKRSMPLVTMMDTPGADPGEIANRNNQAHSISRLITEASNVDVPNVGVIYGLGYSGGAIPLAASNMILSVRDGVFSTIQPRSLASIARRLNLSWQECAKYVGLSPYELFAQGNIDGIIDFSPNQCDEQIGNLRSAIVGGILRVEAKVKEFVASSPYILDHYRQSLGRYLNPSEQLRKMQASASLKLTKNPTEYLSVFGVAYRYLRYLKVRQRIKSTNRQQYGRLSQQEIPQGELSRRAELERRQTFLKWLQDPDKVIYDDGLSKAWKNYVEKREAVNEERGRLAQLIFGEPGKNFADARSMLITQVGLYLYNRWKGESVGNLRALREFIRNHEDTGYILRQSDLPDAEGLLAAIRADAELGPYIFGCFTYQGKKLLGEGGTADKSEAYVSSQLTSELNLLITGVNILDEVSVDVGGEGARRAHTRGGSDIAVNRLVLQERFRALVNTKASQDASIELNDLTVLDVLLEPDLREAFSRECENLLLFDSVYDQIIANLDSIAEEAQRSQALAKESLERLINTTLDLAAAGVTIGADTPRTEYDLRVQVLDWYQRVMKAPRGQEFFRAVEEWKKANFPHLSDTLFVVVTHLFTHLLLSYVVAERDSKTYNGKIAPRNIGRKKDFWNRLDIAYRDLRMQNVLRENRANNSFDYQSFIDKYFTDFEERYADLLSSDPCAFPGFRLSIEAALDAGIPPCGTVAGIATMAGADGEPGIRVGVLLSNVRFQAGSFDMASAEKFCKLLVECAQAHLPVVCFVSSGGMQTKEGAGALFSMAAVNDRITRFVRDHDLPVIVFGYGDCTGGAQASFVTHPLVQTYYLSGTSMPFAGQIVVQSNLPLNSLLSNYLSQVPGAMQGLVVHPFQEDLDSQLREVDPDIPVPTDKIEDVVRRVTSGVISSEQPVIVSNRRLYADAELIKPVQRMLVHARGCTAVKLVRIAQRRGIQVVLVQSDPDMESVPVDMLGERDALVCIGGNTPDESYLNALSVLSVAERENVDALHPGIGFLSENAQFAELCRSHGINFIGPPVSSMETMGNKSNAINTALRLDVPVVPGSHGILTNADRAAEVAESIGYPVLIKAVHGGGGKGIQVVERPGDLHRLFQRVTMEARAAFGNGDVYLEKYVTRLRHIEVQLLRDTHGNTRVLGLRDCSVQRDKQKVIEESGSTILPDNLKEAVLRHTAKLADEVAYVGAGTVEFIYDLAADAVYFMEMNTRLQVEHPVTEWVSGVDIVGQQIEIAGGGSIADLEINETGYAIEARVNAESVQKGASGLVFKPHPGKVTVCEFPEEDDVEVIASVATDKFVSPFYDSMVAQIVVHAADRPAAIEKLLDYLGRVRIEGICTNIPLVRRVLADNTFRAGSYDTGYLPEFLARIDQEVLIEEIERSAGEQSGGIDADAIAIEDSDELKVLSPSTAIFYTSPSPSDPAYVTVGELVDLSTTICQLEAFKIFSPLTLGDFNADLALYEENYRYEVTRINMSDGQQVNVGDLLFVVKPVPVEQATAA